MSVLYCIGCFVNEKMLVEGLKQVIVHLEIYIYLKFCRSVIWRLLEHLKSLNFTFFFIKETSAGSLRNCIDLLGWFTISC